MIPRTRSTIARAGLAIVAVGLICRVVRFAVNMPLWGDEAFVAVNLIARPFAGLSRPLEYYQVAPIGFLWAEWVAVRTLGASEWALRLLPFLSGLGALVLFARFARENVDGRSALLATAILAASFYPIRHANEVKPYATDLFLGLVATILARAIWRAPGSAGAWIGLTAAGVVGVWASYPLIFVVGGVGMVLAWRVVVERSGRGMVLGAVCLGGTLASWAAMYVGFGRPQALAAPFLTQMTTWEDSFPPVTRPWALPWWLLKTHAGNMLAYPYGGNNLGSLLTFLLVVRGAWAMVRRDRGLLALLLAPLVPAFFAAALHRYPYGSSARISLFFAPAACLLAGRGLAAILAERLPRARSRRAAQWVTAGLGAFAVAGAVSVVALPYKSPVDLAYRRAVRDLADRARPGDRWVVFNGLVNLPEIKGLMLMPWLGHAAQFHFYALRDAPVPLDWMPRPEAVEPSPSGRTWLIVHSVGYDRTPPGLLDAYLSRLGALRGTPAVSRTEPTSGEVVATVLYPAPGGRPAADE